jgi:hypothetical protein
MCNPRKIIAKATRQITEAWRAEIQRTARLGGTVTGRAELVQPLGSMLAPTARRAFEQAVSEDRRWVLRDGAYHLDVLGGEALYRPETGELELSVELSAYVEVEGTARRVREGTIDEVIEATAEAGYYSDGWGGYTRERAQQQADRLVETEAGRLVGERRAAAKRRAQQKTQAVMDEEGADAQAAASKDARALLIAEHEHRREQLDQDAQSLLDRIHEQSLRGVMETVALGFQNVLVAYARAHGVRQVDVTRIGDTVQVQFQMEV